MRITRFGRQSDGRREVPLEPPLADCQRRAQLCHGDPTLVRVDQPHSVDDEFIGGRGMGRCACQDTLEQPDAGLRVVCDRRGWRPARSAVVARPAGTIRPTTSSPVTPRSADAPHGVNLAATRETGPRASNVRARGLGPITNTDGVGLAAPSSSSS